MNTIKAGVLEVAYLESGPRDGWPVILSHGFPFDAHAYDEVALVLADRGARVIVPYLRGFGPTRFLAADTFRSGQQAALGYDLLMLLDALDLETAILAGYDWGGLASCVATVLWPERVAGLVSLASYDIIDVGRMRHEFPPEVEQAVWCQHLFQTGRGWECLTTSRRELCRMLWRQWSPDWRFDDEIFERTAASFDNPDFVGVVIHAYRHTFGLAAGDPSLEHLERRLAIRPPIAVPSVTLDGIGDTLKPGGTADQAKMFVGRHEHRRIQAGHNLPQETPDAFIDAVLTLRHWLLDAL